MAEIGAAYLCADLGITPETREDHAAYIGSWLKVLKDEKHAIFTAASHAERAVGHLHGYQAPKPEADQEPLPSPADLLERAGPRLPALASGQSPKPRL